MAEPGRTILKRNNVSRRCTRTYRDKYDKDDKGRRQGWMDVQVSNLRNGTDKQKKSDASNQTKQEQKTKVGAKGRFKSLKRSNANQIQINKTKKGKQMTTLSGCRVGASASKLNCENTQTLNYQLSHMHH